MAEARDGAQALDEVDRSAPDLIMLDLNLPGLDGYGVLQRLRSRPSTSQIPVIVLTAKGDEDNEVRVFQMGADDFLTKPFRARALSARLEAVLSRRRVLSQDPDALDLIKASVRAQPGYTLAALDAGRKLNQNESPYDLPDSLKREIVERVARAPWPRYPEFVPARLLQRLAEWFRWPAEGSSWATVPMS